jgi:hypothetical protein
VVISMAAGASGILERLPVPPPAIAVSLTVLLLLLLRTSRRVRVALASLGPRPLVLFHLTRVAAGAYFLVLYRRGELPGEFALVAGWGDIAVGLGALVVTLTCLPARSRLQEAGLLFWNAAGLADILGVLGNGIRLFTRNPALGEAFTSLPLAMLPTFVVPIVIVTHVLLFARPVHRPTL